MEIVIESDEPKVLDERYQQLKNYRMLIGGDWSIYRTNHSITCNSAINVFGTPNISFILPPLRRVKTPPLRLAGVHWT